MKQKLRIGLLIDNTLVDLWEQRVIRNILDSEFGEIVLIIKIGSSLIEQGGRRYSFFYRLYERFDRYFFRDRVDYDVKSDISAIIEGIPSVSLIEHLQDGNKKSCIDISQEICRFKLDSIIRLGNKPIPDSFLCLYSMGLWYYKIGLERITSEGPSGYWEIARNLPEIGAAIHMIDQNGKDFVILPMWVSTYPSSVNVTRDQILGYASVLFPRLIKEVSIRGLEYLDVLKQTYGQPTPKKNVQKKVNPSFFVVLKSLILIFRKYFIRKILNLNPDPWFLIYKTGSNKIFNLDSDLFKIIKAPSGYFWADPFIVELNDRFYIFIEEYVYKTRKGHISVIELDEGGKFCGCKKILERSYHMSYPFIFEFENTFYMVPETSGNNTIELYRCTNFPGDWEFVTNLMENVKAVDTTLFFKKNNWWLFTSLDLTDTKTAQFNELFLFYTPDLLTGSWQSHPYNPIVTDLKSSRSAGRIIQDGQKILRPSQDCSSRYGYALNLNQVIELDELNYIEVPAFKIVPHNNRKFLGVHTINKGENLTVLDISEPRRKLNISHKKGYKEIRAPFSIVDPESQRRIKILFFIDGLTSGGKERRLTELMKGLKLQPYIEYELVLMNKAVHYTMVFDLGIKIHYVIRRTRKDLSVFREFYRICEDFHPDIVHCWDSMTAVYLIPICFRLRIRIINGMVVDTPVQQNILNKNWLRARLTFPFADMVVGNSNAGLAAYRAPSGRSICIYNGMDLKRFEYLPHRQQLSNELFGVDCLKTFVVGMVAAFQPRKDYRTLVNAAIRIVADYNEIRFIMVGSGLNLDDIKKTVPTTLKDRIIFPGTRSDVEAIINIFDIGILLTNTKIHGEGISNSIIEYMALRKPVIATRGGGTDEIVIDNFNGFLIDTRNENQLIEKILFFFRNRNLIDEFGRNGRKLIEEKFDIKIMSESYINLYRKITFY